MTFSEFAQKLYPIIGGGESRHSFTRSLFESIMDEKGWFVLDEYSSESFSSYYKGGTNITKLAQKIKLYTDYELFSEFICEFDDHLVEDMCEAFGDDIPGISLHNAHEELAKFFNSIITEAAAAKRKKRAAGNPEEKSTEDEGDACKNRPVTHQQINVMQNGETNINMTNNGTINFDLRGD